MDIVNLGIKIQDAGQYFISIDDLLGELASNDTNIFIYDNFTNTQHNLKISPYGFQTNAGEYNNRFLLKYQSTLNNESFKEDSKIWIFTDNHINIKSTIKKIKSVEIFDTLGRKIYDDFNINEKSYVTNEILKQNQVWITRITLENNEIVTKKLIF